MSDEFVKLLKCEERGHQAIKEFATELCEQFVNQREFQHGLASSAMLSPISHAADRVHKICRCFAHLLNCKVAGEPTSHTDVYWLTKYAGKDLCERTMRDQLIKPNTSWSSMVNEIVRTAGKAALLTGPRQELEALLEQGANSAEDVEKVVSLFQKLKASLRTLELQTVSASMREMLQNAGQRLLKGEGPMQGSMLVDQLIVGLNMFAASPGVLSTIQELQSWMTKNRSSVATHDLLNLVQVNLQTWDLGVPKLRQLVQKTGDEVVPPMLQENMDSFLTKMLTELRQQVPGASTNSMTA